MRAAEALYGGSFTDIGNLEQLHILTEAGDLDGSPTRRSGGVVHFKLRF